MSPKRNLRNFRTPAWKSELFQFASLQSAIHSKTAAMNSSSTPLFILAGPTAVGKSEVAVQVAERCGGEVVSADAFQVYAGLDVLTAKPDAALLARVPHHLIGEIPRTTSFDVAHYLKLAEERIADIRARGRIPIVVGGAGFYLKALTHGLP